MDFAIHKVMAWLGIKKTETLWQKLRQSAFLHPEAMLLE